MTNFLHSKVLDRGEVFGSGPAVRTDSGDSLLFIFLFERTVVRRNKHKRLQQPGNQNLSEL